jgi:RNA polymerase sigma-70 factor (ECF subfamily)
VEEGLVAKAQRGDLEAYSRLTESRTVRLLAAARLILRDEESAADAVQDTLVQAWVNLRGLRDPDRFDAWLHRMLVRFCIRTASRSRMRHVREIRAVAESHTDTPDAQRALAARDELERGLQQLPPDQRAALVVRYYLDLPLSECAEVLGVPMGTVQSRVSRALQAMRAAIEADGRPAPLVEEVVR